MNYNVRLFDVDDMINAMRLPSRGGLRAVRPSTASHVVRFRDDEDAALSEADRAHS